ncbi:hypothetical protein PILCRDRAFT_828543 [Piloderma croceum F 1598]|uniref:Uncharacterized protein n=1 Tax=Piloderma croceum (strain F 1598) TaxID=765440 RepID=A0A0C3B9X9_PILCF|nr:hypothetical protein PILCRDRAFT_828543 [Piloderma croceum F 1598]
MDRASCKLPPDLLVLSQHRGDEWILKGSLSFLKALSGHFVSTHFRLFGARNPGHGHTSLTILTNGPDC